jgi:hypothetical protein
MRRQEFQKSKDDVLGWIESLIAEAHAAPSIAPEPAESHEVAA